jgi:hypothetical protein
MTILSPSDALTGKTKEIKRFSKNFENKNEFLDQTKDASPSSPFAVRFVKFPAVLTQTRSPSKTTAPPTPPLIGA